MNEIIEKARYSSDPEEQYQVGLMFRDGNDVERDYKEAKEWFRKAAYRNHAASQFNLGVISAGNLVGNFSSKYETKSWLEKALKQDYPGAKELLEMIEADEELPDAVVLFALGQSTEVSGAEPDPPTPSTDELAPPAPREPVAIADADKPALSSNPEPEVPISAKVKEALKNKEKTLMSSEGKAQFSASMLLLGQTAVNYLDMSDSPEKCSEYLTNIITQLDELGSDFADYPEYIEELDNKRDELQTAFEQKRTQLDTERNRKAGDIVESAERTPSLPPVPEATTEKVIVEQQEKPPVIVEEKEIGATSPVIAQTSVTKPLYDKDLSGAVTEYQPVDLAEYDGEPWDIRISMDYAPLEEAFYFTVNDSDATSESVQVVLGEYALNTNRRGELDSAEYPQLPHIQEELLGYYNSAISGKAQLSVYVNKRPSEAPIQLQDKVSDHLSTCVFSDGSHDYRLLDLIFVIESKSLGASELSVLREEHGPSYMLFLIDYLKRNSPPNSSNDLSASAPFSAYLTAGGRANDRFPEVTRTLEVAEKMGFITAEGGLSITQEGHPHLESLTQEVNNLRQRYECYQSVSVNPPALGVPNGFDARIQIMRKQSVDVVRAIFLFACVFDEDALFGVDNWADDFESGGSFSAIMDAFQYESDFTDDILDPLMSL